MPAGLPVRIGRGVLESAADPVSVELTPLNRAARVGYADLGVHLRRFGPDCHCGRLVPIGIVVGAHEYYLQRLIRTSRPAAGPGRAILPLQRYGSTSTSATRRAVFLLKS